MKRVKHAVGLAIALSIGLLSQAAPPPGREIVLHARDEEGGLLTLRVPANILLAQLQQFGNGGNINLNQIGGAAVSANLYDTGNTALKVNCVVGCSATAGFTDNSGFTTGSTTVTNLSGLFNDSATNLTSGNAGAIRATTDRMLFVNIGKINGTAPTLTGSSLNVNCTGGCSGSVGFTDNSAFTAGTTAETNIGGVFNDGLTALSSGNAAAARLTPNRGLHINLRNNSGTEMATSANPLRIDPTGTTTQPVSGTVTANQGTANAAPWNENVAQFGGSAVATGTGAGGAGIPRVTVSNDSAILGTKTNNNAAPGATNFGTLPCLANASAPSWTEGNQVNCSEDLSGNLRVGQATAANLNVRTDESGATGSGVPARAAYVGGNGSGNLTGITVCDHWTPISLTANTQIITGTASKQTYICSINLVAGAATNVALVEGTGTTCGTSTAGMAGGATAATGWNFAANGGLTQGSGVGAILRTATAADNVCLFVSAANQVSGAVSWTQF